MTFVVSIIILMVGLIMGFLFAYVMICEKQKHVEPAQETIRSGIDPKRLIAWIENYTHNYEYISPPTVGEIIKKIHEMEDEE